MKKRTWTALLAATLCVGLLAGCGGGSSAGTGNADESENNGSAADPDETFEEEPYYRESGEAYPDLAVFPEPGIYTEPITIQISGAEGADIYYTVDGSDPLTYDLSEEGVPLSGKLVGKNGIQLADGAVELMIRAVNPETLEIGPLYSVSYIVKLPFDTTSSLIDQDSYYDYYINLRGVMRKNVQTGEEKCVFSAGTRIVSGLCVTSELTTLAKQYGEDYGDNLPFGVRLEWDEHKDDLIERSMVSFKLRQSMSDYNNEMLYSFALGGELEEWTNTHRGSSSYHVGNGGWCVGGGQAAWFDNMQEPVATEETVLWCELLTDEIALRSKEIDGVWTLLARDPNGENERTLFTSEEEFALDAIICRKVLYHVGEDEDTIHMVYDLDTGEQRENGIVKEGREVKGYTTRNIYYADRDVLSSYDYNKL